MVQVDVFWSYGLAAGLTLAAGKQLKKCDSPWVNKYFLGVVGWIALFFLPSGVYLIWEFPSWETMFVASGHGSIPAWFVVLFTVTNLTQGILGYYVTYWLINANRWKAAVWQPIWTHACMIFIFTVGWDGTGFSRFTYSGTYEEFHAGVAKPWYMFFQSDVFYALVVMALFLVPSYLYLVCRWTKEAKSLTA